MNQKYEGGGFMFCPDAAPDDGLLDFCVSDHIGIFRFLSMFPGALKGKHLKYRGVSVFRAQSAMITTEPAQYVHVDGESGRMAGRIRVFLLKEKLRMLN